MEIWYDFSEPEFREEIWSPKETNWEWKSCQDSTGPYTQRVGGQTTSCWIENRRLELSITFKLEHITMNIRLMELNYLHEPP